MVTPADSRLHLRAPGSCSGCLITSPVMLCEGQGDQQAQSHCWSLSFKSSNEGGGRCLALPRQRSSHQESKCLQLSRACGPQGRLRQQPGPRVAVPRGAGGALGPSERFHLLCWYGASIAALAAGLWLIDCSLLIAKLLAKFNSSQNA